ncbi:MULTISPECIES: hypothetical protein [Ensifer]|jgi:hypothetical protein|uniref:Uncharacterized protein n=1 Tax=Ensifer canadensis TaxID=555315 RepID=A0AAW4FXE8_9HYPH|nr:MULTISPECIES: hypothetical protein [Ensifer]MDP9630869.1 hypothetical protein [Ensifer adhaerens]KQU77002.1 hypothetical protein ASD00_37320 [Ensifer sp. Root31]KQW58696.1 hypothetical protein ASD02_06865 [Ensifer sp. Root1252]KQW74401.1 hypothetical protein ASD03_07505 [Ensifer sp. Root127]KQY62192.1 hypothetical protein ASD52_16365 [Ensifer sp. Root142]
MARTFQSFIHGVWVLAIISAATSVGIVYGWQSHGWVGASLYGLIGYGSGVLFAYSPSMFFDFLELLGS